MCHDSDVDHYQGRIEHRDNVRAVDQRLFCFWIGGGKRLRESHEAEKKRVVIADDDDESRRFVRIILEHTRDVVVVGEACDGQEAIHLVQELHPDM